MPGWLVRILKRIHELAAEGRYRLTYKAQWEAASLGLAPEDVQDVLVSLGTSDSAGRVASGTTGEWMYVFKPYVGAQVLYVKLIVRNGCGFRLRRSLCDRQPRDFKWPPGAWLRF